MTRKDLLPLLVTDPKWSPLRHIFLQLVILLITSVVFIDRGGNAISFEPNFVKGWVCYYATVNVVIYINIYILTPKLMLVGKLSEYITLTFVFSTVLALIVNGSHFYFCPPQGFSNGQMALFFIMLMLSSYIIYGMLVTGTSSFILLQEWIRSKTRQEELEVNTLRAELKILRNQVNPHFLFNTINNANTLMKKDGESASFVLEKLKELLNYQMHNATKQYILLSEEIKLLDNYLLLEKIRRDKFSYEINKAGNMEDILIPPLLFIIFVENAVKYNPDDGSKIIISFERDNAELIFCCQNTKSGSYERSDVGGIGLANVQKRLDLLFPTTHTLAIEETENTFAVKLRIKV